MPSSDIILIGAGRDPHTKQLRARQGFPKRNLWVGPMHVRTGMRFPVDREFLKKHYDVIAKGIRDGVLLVEYKYDKYVDEEELKTLASGSEAEQAAYEEEAGKEAVPEVVSGTAPEPLPVEALLPQPEPVESTPLDAVQETASDTSLPEGWKAWSKPELLALCEERGIDVSDAPSNKELRRRLDAYTGL